MVAVWGHLGARAPQYAYTFLSLMSVLLKLSHFNSTVQNFTGMGHGQNSHISVKSVTDVCQSNLFFFLGKLTAFFFFFCK